MNVGVSAGKAEQRSALRQVLTAIAAAAAGRGRRVSGPRRRRARSMRLMAWRRAKQDGSRMLYYGEGGHTQMGGGVQLAQWAARERARRRRLRKLRKREKQRQRRLAR